MRRLGLLLGVALTWAPWLLYDLILNCPFSLNDISIYFIFRDYSTVFLIHFFIYFDSDPTQSARWSSLEADPTPGGGNPKFSCPWFGKCYDIDIKLSLRKSFILACPY